MDLTRAATALVVLLAACQSPPARPEPVGRIYTYLRTNRDGTEAESISVYRLDRTHLEVFKRRERCTSAALVTAELDSSLQQTIGLVGGRLQPDNQRQSIAFMTWDSASQMIRARIDLPDFKATDSVHVPDTPWHLYDFDLASLTVARRPGLKTDFSFGLPLVLVGSDPTKFLQYLGRADARLTEVVMHNDRPALHYEVSGPAFGAQGGGSLWFDREEGHILEASWGVPNHAEYKDFLLRLIAVDDGGAATWDSTLRAQFTGCPTDQ